MQISTSVVIILFICIAAKFIAVTVIVIILYTAENEVVNAEYGAGNKIPDSGVFFKYYLYKDITKTPDAIYNHFIVCAWLI